MKKRLYLLFSLVMLLPALSFAQPWVVTSTAPVPDWTDCFHKKPTWATYAPGTLAWALDQASNYTGPLAKKITFSVPANSTISWAATNSALCIPNLEIDGTVTGGNVTFTSNDKVIDLQGTGMKLTNLKFAPLSANPVYDGFWVTGTSCVISGCVSAGFFNGANIKGNTNVVTGSTFSNNSNHGLFVFGSTNTISNTTFNNNGFSGISLNGSTGTADNNIVQNCISFSNIFNGYACENGANGNTFQSNYAYSNAGAGIILYNSNNTKICGNTVGLDNTNAIKGNGIGVSIEGTSSNTTVGSLDGSTCNGNTITQNTTGVVVTGASALNNLIVRNSIFCNSDKGISLLLNGNANYGLSTTASPLFVELTEPRANYISGKSPANARIDIYLRDAACDNGVCASSNAGNKFQGKTWLATVTANAAGVWEYLLVAPATKTNLAITATSATGATSEFAYCQSSCVQPNLTKLLTGGVICQGSNGTITITGAEAGVTYQVLKQGTTTPVLATVTPATAGDVSMTINSVNLPVGTNNFTVQAEGTGCPSFLTMTNPNPVVISVNASINTGLTVSSVSPLCLGSSGTITIANTQTGVSYQAQKAAVNVGTAVVGTGGTISITIPSGSLVSGSNTFTILASNAPCTPATLTNSATILVNKAPNAGLSVSSVSPICVGTNGSVTIVGSETGVSYQAVLNSVNVGTAVVGNGGSITLSIPSGSLSTGNNTISVVASIAGCTSVTLGNTTTIAVNASPVNKTVTYTTPLCQGTDAALSIASSQLGISYQVKQGSTDIGTAVVGTGGTIVLTIPNGSLIVGTNNFTVVASVGGCSSLTLTPSVSILVNKSPNSGLLVSSVSPICVGVNGSVTIAGAETGVSYQAVLNSVNVGTAVVGNGGSITLSIPSGSLITGNNTISVVASIAGCTSVTLTNTTTIAVNASPVNKTVTYTTPLCQGTDAALSIASSQLGISYQVKQGSTDIGTAVVGTGGTIVLTIPNGSLIVGTNNFTVVASVGGCSSLTLTPSVSILVNKSPNAGLSISSVSPICVGTNGLVTITGAETGVSYQAVLNSANVGVALTGSNADLTLTIPSGSLNTGSNTISVVASIAGCTSATLTNTTTIVVNASPNKAITVTSVSPICSGSTGSITVVGSQAGVSYQLQTSGGVNIGFAIVGDGTDKTFTVPVVNLPVSTNNFQITASIGGCTTVLLNTKPSIVVNQNPDLTYAISAVSPICLGNTTTVTIANSQVGVSYQASISGVNTGTAVAGTGTAISIVIPATSLTPEGTFIIDVFASNEGCGVKKMNNSATVVVNPGITLSLGVVAIPTSLCENGSSAITLSNSQTGVSYQLQTSPGGVNVGTAQIGTGGTLSFSTGNLTGSLIGTVYTYQIQATIGGCSPAVLTAKPTVTVKKAPSAGLTLLSGSPYCSNVTNATITIKSSELGVSYQAQKGGSNIGSAVTGTGGDITLSIPTSSLTLGATGNVITVQASNAPCTTVDVNTITIVVNKAPDNTLEVTGLSPICTNTDGSVTVLNSEAGVSYQAFVGSTLAGTAEVGTGGAIVLKIPSGSLTVGVVNVINVQASITGCTAVTLTDTAGIKVNAKPLNTLALINNGPVCNGSAVTVSVVNAQTGVSYQLLSGTTAIGSVLVGTGGTLDFTIPVNGLSIGDNIFGAQISIGGCGIDTLLAKTTVKVSAQTTAKTIEVDNTVACQGGTAPKLNIVGAETGVVYQVFNNGGLTPIATISSTDLPYALSTGLITGTNVITVTGTVSPCSSVPMSGSVTITVNTPVDSTVSYTVVSPVCQGNGSAITITNPQSGVTYEFFVDGVSVGSGSTSVTLSASQIPTAGTYVVTITGSVTGCGTVKLKGSKSIVVLESLDQTLQMLGSTICASTLATDKATITIKAGQPGVTYTIYDKNNIAVGIVSNTDATAKDLIYEIIAPNLQVGANTYTASASNGGTCSSVTLNAVTVYSIKDNFELTYDSVICRSNVQSLSVSTLAPGATEYVWTSKQNASIISTSTIPYQTVSINYSSIPASVRYDTLEVYAAAMPNADCGMYKKQFIIHLLNNVDAQDGASDSICAYIYERIDTDKADTVHVRYYYQTFNAVKYKWAIVNAPAGTWIKPLTLDSSYVEVSFPAQPRNTNVVNLEFAVSSFSLCTNSYLPAKTKKGVVIAIPDVNAGLDKDTVTYSYPAFVALDGSKTTVDKDGITHPATSYSLTGNKPNFSYDWNAISDDSQIYGIDTNITAIAKTTVLEADYELLVANKIKIRTSRDSICAAKDDIHVKIKPMIDPSTAFTPNGDGLNGTWVIKNLEYFKNNNIVIFNQWGSKVFEAAPYNNDWAGTHNGEALPMATYYYILDLAQDNIKPIAGSITIVK